MDTLGRAARLEQLLVRIRQDIERLLALPR